MAERPKAPARRMSLIKRTNKFLNDTASYSEDQKALQAIGKVGRRRSRRPSKDSKPSFRFDAIYEQDRSSFQNESRFAVITEKPHTKDSADQTDFVESPKPCISNQTNFPWPDTDLPPPLWQKKGFIYSRNFLNDKGFSPRAPYEKTVYFVKSDLSKATKTQTERNNCKATFAHGAPIATPPFATDAPLKAFVDTNKAATSPTAKQQVAVPTKHQSTSTVRQKAASTRQQSSSNSRPDHSCSQTPPSTSKADATTSTSHAQLDCQPSPINCQPSPTNHLLSPTKLDCQLSPTNRQPSPINCQPSPTNHLLSPTKLDCQPSPTNRQPSPINCQPSPTNHLLSPTKLDCQPSPTNRQPSPINCQLSPTNHLLSPTKLDCQPSPTNRQPSPTNLQPPPINRQPSPINCQPSPINCQPSPINCQASSPNSQHKTEDYDNNRALPLSPGRLYDYLRVQNQKLDCTELEKDGKMSYYTTEIISPTTMARKQEKEDLQMLNDRFTSYISKVRQLSEHSNHMDTASFVKQTRILEEEVANLKTLYERELDAIRQELNAVNREKSNYQLQCEKNKQAAIDFESRMAVESDKNRRLVDDMNTLQRTLTTVETELMNLKQTGDGRVDFQHLQREMDKIIRENEDHKHRQEQESLLRTEAEDRCHTLVKKLEFNEQVHAQQIAEVRERLEQSQATIISLESRISVSTQNDLAIPDVLKQVREQSEIEFKRYQLESQETYNRNISVLKCQMDNDAATIERMSRDKTELQGQTGELMAKIRNLEGQLLTIEHQKNTVENLIKHERDRAADQLREMEVKVRDMQELVFSKMREANNERDLHIPLKAEIEAMKILLEEEEKRLQLPLPPLNSGPTYASAVPLVLPAVTPSCPPPQPDYTTAPPSGQQQYSVTNQQYSATSHNNQQYSATTHNSQQYSPEAAHQYSAAPASAPQYQTSTECYVPEPPSTPQQEPLFTHVPMPCSQDSGLPEFVGSATKYTYETTPSLNRLQIESPVRNTPRAIGPVSRIKSAPVRPGAHVQVVPTKLGQGKDYFDEMFRDLTRETLYTQTRPKSSPMERPGCIPQNSPPRSPSRDNTNTNMRQHSYTDRQETCYDQPVPSTVQEAATHCQPERPQSRTSDHMPDTNNSNICRNSERPHSSVFHDYTTSTSSATGDVKILEVNQDGKYVRLFNDGKQELEFGGFMIQQNVGGHPVAVYRFPPRTKFPSDSTVTVWSSCQEPIEHQPPRDFVWREQQKWGTGPECTTILCKPNGQAVAWMTAAHRFTKNIYDENSNRASPTEEPAMNDGTASQCGQEQLTEMNVNLNEPKPEAVYLRREKQSPPSLVAQKHPHGTSPGNETHPQTGQPRPFTYGNDNSSVNRQSRVQSTRPDPVAGQPYTGGPGVRAGSAPLRKYKTTPSAGNIRGSGAIANRCDAGETSEPPNPFQTPRKRFESGLEQVQSQHHVHFNPPMPRPPLFSTW